MILTLFLLILSSCGEYGAYSFLFKEDDVERRFSEFKDVSSPSLSETVLPSKYSGIIVTDVHFGGSETFKEEKFFERLSSHYDTAEDGMKPRFLVCLGDTANSGASSELKDFNSFAFKVKTMAKEKLNLSSEDDFPVYTILGNHDLYNNGWDNWKKLVYPYTSSFYFDVGKFRFYGLDTASGSVGNDQLKAWEKHIKSNSMPKIVLSHYPIFAGGIALFEIHDTYERNRLITDFAKNNVKMIFEGHYHSDVDYNWGKFMEVDVGSFLYNRLFALVTMDESDDSVSVSRFTY